MLQSHPDGDIPCVCKHITKRSSSSASAAAALRSVELNVEVSELALHLPWSSSCYRLTNPRKDSGVLFRVTGSQWHEHVKEKEEEEYNIYLHTHTHTKQTDALRGQEAYN